MKHSLVFAMALGSALAGAQGKAILISWDGAADWVVDRLMAEGRLPNLSRMAREGIAAESMTTGFPSKTAVGHANMLTGFWPNVHGVTGNLVPKMPRAMNAFVDSRPGFASDSLLAEPIFVTAAKAGKKVVVLSAPQSYPPETYSATLGEAAKRYVSFSGFETEIAPAGLETFAAKDVPAEPWTDLPKGNGPYREIAFKVGDTPIYALAFDDPKDPVNGYDTLLVRPLSRQLSVAKSQILIKPKPATDADDNAWAGPLKVTKGELYGFVSFRLWEMTPDLERVQLYHGKVSLARGAASPQDTLAYNKAYRGFHDDPFRNYEAGMLGRTIWQGGSGEAEARVVEIVRRDVENLKRGVRFALKKWAPDLLLHYEPMTDSAGHTWMGVLDPGSPGYSKTVAERLWPYYARIFQLQDEWLGDVAAAAPGYALAVVSDHGMEGVTKTFYPNAALENAGLLKRTFGNQVEPAQTKVAAPPWSDFFVVVNTLDWKQGIVAPTGRDAVLEEAFAALRAAKDPDTGELIVRRVFRAGEVPGTGGPTGGDLYLDLAPGYYPSSRVSDKLVTRSSSPIGSGVHGYEPTRRTMQAIFYAAGPGLAAKRLGPVRQIDVAPTLAAMLGIARPPSYAGTSLLQQGLNLPSR